MTTFDLGAITFDLGAIRRGLADTLAAAIDRVQVLSAWPDALALGSSTCLLVLPADPYVVYARGIGFSGRHKVGMRVVILPLQARGPELIQAEIDELLSCGARSIREALAADLSAGGTACSVTVSSAGVREYQLGGQSLTGAEVMLDVEARC